MSKCLFAVNFMGVAVNEGTIVGKIWAYPDDKTGGSFFAVDCPLKKKPPHFD